jgi:hypothetical protein
VVSDAVNINLRYRQNAFVAKKSTVGILILLNHTQNGISGADS